LTLTHHPSSREQYADYVIDINKKLPYQSLNPEEIKLYWGDDKLHFTAKGYERMGEIVWDTIKDKIDRT